METRAQSSEPRLGRHLALSALVVAILAVGLRTAAIDPVVAASAATVVALAALAFGLFWHGRHHGRRWQLMWVLLAGSVAVQAVATTRAAFDGLPTRYPDTIDWISVACAVVAALALAGLLSIRARGCALDAVLEGALIGAVCLYLPWVWAVTQGMGQREALAVLAPMAAWIIAAWLLLRLLFLTNEQIVAYRYLGAAFVGLLASHAMLAGTRLDAGSVTRSPGLGVVLWAYCIWGAAALHPSLRKNFEPVQPRAPRFHLPALALCVTATTIGPLTLAVAVSKHDLRGLTGVAAGCAIAPALLVVYLVRQVRNRARAEHRAQHDPLTGLPNQTLFQDRVEVSLARTRRADEGLAVMFLDLDRFKSINDSLGHAVGNQLLQAVARRLRSTVRETDTIARMGGDEFTVLLNNVSDPEEVAVVARKIIDQFSVPFTAGGRELHTTTSIGIAMYPTDGHDVDTLLKHADSAMYRAKARGRDSFEFYTADLSMRAQARLSVESALRRAVDRHTLALHYQPKIDVRTGAVVGLEALARWPHTTVGMIMPNVFIPVAEETGLIAALGEWAIDEACADLRRWLNAGIAPRPVAVNLSVRQLSESDIVEKVARILDRHDIPPHLLELEITESVFMRDLATSAETLRELRDLGVACSIDDFGTGFSGLSYLADMPIDTLKIDQSFVSHICQVHDDAPIVEAIIGMARALQLNVVAEGVETIDQARFLVAHGCDEMQGYLFSPPLPADDIAQLLLLDDHNTIDWLGASVGAFGRIPAQPIAGSRSSTLLAMLCDGHMPDGRAEEIAILLATLVPGETKVAAQSALRAASMRVVVGSFAGLVPLTTGLAAAHVLPQPIEVAVGATLNKAGMVIPRELAVESHQSRLLADGPARASADVGNELVVDPPRAIDRSRPAPRLAIGPRSGAVPQLGRDGGGSGRGTLSGGNGPGVPAVPGNGGNGNGGANAGGAGNPGGGGNAGGHGGTSAGGNGNAGGITPGAKAHAGGNGKAHAGGNGNANAGRPKKDKPKASPVIPK